MKRICGWIAVAAGLAALAPAQEDPAREAAMRAEFERMAAQSKMLGIEGAVMGKPVKGAPYSGTEITETTQVLADGTRIHSRQQVSVYRDSEGRVRRETPGGDVTIWDPVANVSYVLNPKTQTARKLPMAMGKFLFRYTKDGRNVTYMYFRSGKTPAPGERAPGAGFQSQRVIIRAPNAKTESLGRQTIEGVAADGTRETATLAVGAIGNDRPIQIVTERWYSPELQTIVMSRHSDPRTGEEAFRLANVSRAEPPAYLFQVPAGYQVTEQK